MPRKDLIIPRQWHTCDPLPPGLDLTSKYWVSLSNAVSYSHSGVHRDSFFLLNWFKATRSHILDRAGNNDTGLFSLATSKSPPSFGIGTISDSFHGEGNTDVKSELFMISVKIGRIAGRSSFTTAICNLSFPGALFEGNDCTILLISKEVAALNWNSPSSGIKLTGISWCEVGRPLTGARVLCQWWQIIDARGNYRCRKKSPWSQFP